MITLVMCGYSAKVSSGLLYCDSRFKSYDLNTLQILTNALQTMVVVSTSVVTQLAVFSAVATVVTNWILIA